MHRPTHNLSLIALLVLLALAIFGYLVGHRRVPAASVRTTQIASHTGIELEYPSSSWRTAAATPRIPGLPIEHPLLLVPQDDPAQAGLLSGQLPADQGGQASPLPSRFLALVQRRPHVEVVDLIGSQAYRYSRLSLPGYGRLLTLYVIPNEGASPTVLACYAASAFSAYLRSCEHIVATFTPKGRSTTYALTADPAYARQLGALIAKLDADRLALRRDMGPSASPTAMHALAITLAYRFASAAASVSALTPPPVLEPAQTALATSLLRTHDSYRSLAEAAAFPDSTGYSDARAQVDAAEAGVDGALGNFALLGYGHT